jgi:hypothetical protein
MLIFPSARHQKMIQSYEMYARGAGGRLEHMRCATRAVPHILLLPILWKTHRQYR